MNSRISGPSDQVLIIWNSIDRRFKTSMEMIVWRACFCAVCFYESNCTPGRVAAFRDPDLVFFKYIYTTNLIYVSTSNAESKMMRKNNLRKTLEQLQNPMAAEHLGTRWQTLELPLELDLKLFSIFYSIFLSHWVLPLSSFLTSSAQASYLF